MTPEQAKQFEMPFGPHRGLPLEKVDRQYLSDLSEETLLLKQYPGLRDAIKQVLKPSPEATAFIDAKRLILSTGRSVEEEFAETGIDGLEQILQKSDNPVEKNAIEVVLNTIRRR